MSTINKEDVIKLIIQFFRENNLNTSLSTLKRESGVTLNTVESKSQLKQDIMDGKWDIVLKQANQLDISQEKLFNLYEQVAFELIESNEVGTVNVLLRKSNVLRMMGEEEPERYRTIEDYLEKFDGTILHTNQENRLKISQELDTELSIAPNGRLLILIGQSLKWQQQQGNLQPDTTSFDIFRGTVPIQKVEHDVFASKPYVQIKFPGKKTYAECAAFSKNGQYLATGSIDGFIEIWNYVTGKLRKDLIYQQKDSLMAMDKSVLSLAFSRNNELLASGSSDGKIFIWNVKSGQCQKRIMAAHIEGITALEFNKDNSQILSCSYDQTIRIHGLKSTKLLKEFRGHSSFINSVIYSNENDRVLSASSDGTVKIWDAKSTSCLYTVNPLPLVEKGQLNPVGGLGTASVTNIIQLPNSPNQYLLCNKTNALFIMSSKGQIVKSLTHRDIKKDFITAAISPQGEFVYGVTEDSFMYGFQISTGNQIGKVKLTENELIGIASHPLTNVIVAYDDIGHVFFFKAP